MDVSNYAEVVLKLNHHVAEIGQHTSQFFKVLESVTGNQQHSIPSPFNVPPSQQTQLTNAALAFAASQQQQSIQLNSPTSIVFQEQQIQQQIQGEGQGIN